MAHSVDVVVEHDYTAEDDQELSLRRGDVIRNVEQKSGGWWRGELRGRFGLFPDNYVRLLGSTKDANEVMLRNSAPRYCRAMYSYTQANHDELNLSVGDVIQVHGEVEEGWWKGQKGAHVGVFPSNFVIPLEVTPPLPPKPVREQCRVLYPYEAENSDELTLVEGDVLTIISKDVPDKGWWRGELRGKIGLFPDNFVNILHQTVGSDGDTGSKKPARPAKHLLSLNQTKNSTLPSNKKDSRSSAQENVAAVRKSLEINDVTIDTSKSKKDKLDGMDSNEDVVHQKSRRSLENEAAAEKKTRRSLEADNAGGGMKPPIPVKKAGSPVIAMLSELKQKVLSSDHRSSQPSSDTADGALSSKPSSEPILTSISPSPSPLPASVSPVPILLESTMSESFDQVERSAMLNDLRSGRVKGPPRRPPSQALRDDIPLTNGSNHNSSTESAGDIEIKPKAREWEKQRAPWMEELKFNQAKKTSPISEIGRSKTADASTTREKCDPPQPRLSGSSDKILDSSDMDPIKDMPVINPLEMSQSMNALSSKITKISTSVEAHNQSENPVDSSKSNATLSSLSTYMETNNKISPSELRTSISSSASVILRSTTHMPASQQPSQTPVTNLPTSRSSNPIADNKLRGSFIVAPNEEIIATNGSFPSDSTPEQLLIAQLNERIANLERVVEAQEARFTALGARYDRELNALQADIQRLERCVTRV